MINIYISMFSCRVGPSMDRTEDWKSNGPFRSFVCFAPMADAFFNLGAEYLYIYNTHFFDVIIHAPIPSQNCINWKLLQQQLTKSLCFSLLRYLKLHALKVYQPLKQRVRRGVGGRGGGRCLIAIFSDFRHPCSLLIEHYNSPALHFSLVFY